MLRKPSVLTYTMLTVVGLCVISCSSESEPSRPAELSDLYGTWELVSMRVDVAPDVEFLTTGAVKWRFLPNGTVVTSARIWSAAASLDGETVTVADDCTFHDSAVITGSAGRYVTSQTARAYAQGECPGVSAEVASVGTDDDTSLELSIRGDMLIARYVEGSQTFSKVSDDTWDGTGLDPAMIRTWEFSEMRIATFCSGESDGSGGSIPFMGSASIAISADATFVQTYTNFSVASVTCTGTSSGTFTTTKLTVDFNYEAEGTTCTESGQAVPADDNSESSLIDRTVVVGNELIGFELEREPDDTCFSGFRNNHTITTFR